MGVDVIRWILFRTDLTLTANDLLFKPEDGKSSGYIGRICKLVDDNIIDIKTHKHLARLWKLRCYIHLDDPKVPIEYDHYTLRRFELCYRAMDLLFGVFNDDL